MTLNSPASERDGVGAVGQVSKRRQVDKWTADLMWVERAGIRVWSTRSLPTLGSYVESTYRLSGLIK